MAISPDQAQALFCHADDSFTDFQIVETRRAPNGRWSAPVKPSFARRWSDLDPNFSPDGKTVFFISNRSLTGTGTGTGADENAPRPTHDIYFAERQPDGAWSDARRLPPPVNDTDADEWSPVVARNGNLYFGAERAGGKGGTDLWVARRVDGVYQTPENLGEAINTAGLEVDAYIAPDESYLIFSALRRPDSVGSYDLYLSRKVNGAWERARPLAEINTPSVEFTPSVSPDGKWLYFASNRRYAGPLGERLDVPRDDRNIVGIGDGRKGDIYRISMSELGLADSR